MTPAVALAAAKELFKAATAAWTWFVATAVDLLVRMPAWVGFAVLMVILVLLGGSARLTQARLNRTLTRAPQTPVSMLRLELTAFPPLAGLLELIAMWRARKAEKKHDVALVVASIGPSFVLSAVVMVALRIVGELTAPVLGVGLGLSRGLPPWEHLLFGRFIGFAMLQPSVERPFAAGLIVVVLWIAAWWITARVIRIALGADLGRNLAEARAQRAVLPFWRSWAGCSGLVRADDTFKLWMRWVPVATAPLLPLAWSSLDGRPAPTESAWFAVALCSWSAVVLDLLLRGVERIPEAKKQEEPEPEPVVLGWPDVVRDLVERAGVTVPAFAAPPRPVARRRVVPATGIPSPCSSLIAELVPGHPEGRLTPMQAELLARLAFLGFVHVEPPDVSHDLKLKREETTRPKRDDPRHHLLLAPEGAGRTTLGILAACDHVLVHGRSVVVIARDQGAADRLSQRMEGLVSGSTLRWNIRVRRLGSAVLEDLARGLVPDVVVASLHDVVVELLAHPEAYGALLQRVGLFVLDDINDYAGPVEVHAQLALRRLWRRVAHEQHAASFTQRTEPITLALGAETMQDTEMWARSLVGMDLVVHREGVGGDAAAATVALGAADGAERTEAPKAGAGDDAQTRKKESKTDKADKSAKGTKGGKKAASNDAETAGDEDARTDEAAAGDGTGKPTQVVPAAGARTLTRAEEAAALPGQQLFVQLAGFTDSLGQPLGVEAIVESCERLGVPWCYRTAGDGRRHIGRAMVRLREEPAHAVEDPTDAHVVFVDGCFTEVQRELQRLVRAGAHAVGMDAEKPLRLPVGVVMVTDVDEAVAFEERDTRSELARQVNELPRPLIRAPGGVAVKGHLAAELLGGWTELKDVLDVFDVTIADTIRRLASEGLIVSESRPDLPPGAVEVEERVYVRLLGRALELGAATQILPPRVVDDVEHASASVVPLVDRASLTVLGHMDEPTATYRFYPGRVFETARGRYVVATDEKLSEAARALLGEGGIAVEPYLENVWSAPRRSLDVLADGALEEHRVLLGDRPLRVRHGRASVTVAHRATAYLEPATARIRQHLLFEEGRARESYSFRTEAVWIHPEEKKPTAGATSAADFIVVPGPTLTVRMARLLVLTLRMVLPNMQRRGDEDLDVALWLAPSADGTASRWALARLDEPLGPDDAIVVFDVLAGGNGASAAFRRDGLELALRLVRLAIERVLEPTRVRARCDHQGTLEEIEADALERRARRAGRTGQTGLPRPATDSGVERERKLRRDTLAWLDERLRREGQGPEGLRANIARDGYEPGEGDEADLGRVWMTESGKSGDLVWTRHAWQMSDGDSLTVDVGFDRALLVDDGRGGPRDKRLLALVDEARAAAKETAAKQGASGAAAHADDGPRTEVLSLAGQPAGGAADVLAAAVAVLVESNSTLDHLRNRLRTHERLQQHAYADVVTALVQAIPTVQRDHVKDALPTSPLVTLSARAGDPLSRALLMAALRDDATRPHVFYAPAQRQAALAWPAGSFQRSKAEQGKGGAKAADAVIALGIAQGWAASRGQRAPSFAGVVPVPGDADTLEVYAPELIGPGAGHLPPDAWVLLPLDVAWRAIVAGPGPSGTPGANGGEGGGAGGPSAPDGEMPGPAPEAAPAAVEPSSAEADADAAPLAQDDAVPAPEPSEGTVRSVGTARLEVVSPEEHERRHVTIYPAQVRDRAADIVKAAMSPLEKCLTLFEWMHEHIAYRTDMENYAEREYVATPLETLERRSGDCEDHAILFASMAATVGVAGHFVLAPGHAAYTVDLSDRAPDEVKSEIVAFYTRRARSWGLKAGQFPTYQSKLAKGWRNTDGGMSRVGASAYEFFTSSLAEIHVEPNGTGGTWLLVDSATVRVLGGWTGVVKQGCAVEPGVWAEGTRRLEALMGDGFHS